VDVQTGKSLVPIFFEDNFLTLMPGERRFIKINTYLVSNGLETKPLLIYWKGLNVKETSNLF